MRACALGIALLMGLTACGGASDGSDGGSAGGGGSINITLSGAITGTSTKLDKAECGDVATARKLHIYSMGLYPVIGGKQYHLAMVINPWSGPVQLSLPQDPATGIPVLFSLQTPDGKLFLNDYKTTGSIAQRSDAKSGTIALQNLTTMGVADALSVSATYKCP